VNTQPPYPLLVVDPKGWLELEADNQPRRFSLYGALNTKRWSGYDSEGKQWRVLPDSFPYPDAWWTRLLANTFYNPRFNTELRWVVSGSYTLGELQTLICQLVDKDDDILTQFVEADEIKLTVQGCRTFDELIRKLKSMKNVRQ
jgi:hypothetical protein